ncbi:MAG: hypothetical protein COW00_20205 [Bdellovibrio sp. CG12_big_fil_rev_8_21_14_0_65_39_13]|nr:MAG: hypothetical protein COW78_15415 [Bdellovibrio sp. CG22_combo_CG10-13_8_21_14_all_39_27]PIQ57553.1 MAG: hypothetical protein COW00_20205 [Bdellovibrio sp. CG12_big_fil_rev_8_21_14_0_65_39_13]PIR33756.1 MAG: hypothetical protein COV37_15295 [Bdellovibrio sp. CG11_big_fil_rev_8_21_14_0_20_39_38]
MKIFSPLILASLFLLSVATASSGDWIELKKADVKIELPKDWIAQKDMLGMPLVIYSPIKNTGRVTISITPTGIEDAGLDAKGLAEGWDKYKEGRLNWLKRIGGRTDTVFPYVNENWKYLKNIHHVGHRYYLADVHYTEHSYYVECHNQMFHIKSLYRYEEYKGEEQFIENVVKSFECKNKKVP